MDPVPLSRWMFTYQQQTEYRDRLREQGRERVSEIVAKINAGEYLNPRIEELLVQLSDRLSRTTGKKVYGYIADAAKVKNSKPAADIYLAAAEGLKLDPSVCIGIEDAEAGIEAIHAAGMKAIGIGSIDSLPKADVLIDSTVNLTLRSIL